MFRDREALDLGKLMPFRLACMAWRRQLAALPNPPRVCVTEVPLLYEVGAETRFDKVVVITAPTSSARRRGRADDREARLFT